MYNKLDKTNLKLRFSNESTFVDEKNKRVIHTIDWSLDMPYLMHWLFVDIASNDYGCQGRAKGMAVCSPNDKFDPEIGKKIARSIAESNAYFNAAKAVSRRVNYLLKLGFKISEIADKFEERADSIITHNRSYQKSLIK